MPRDRILLRDGAEDKDGMSHLTLHRFIQWQNLPKSEAHHRMLSSLSPPGRPFRGRAQKNRAVVTGSPVAADWEPTQACTFLAHTWQTEIGSTRIGYGFAAANAHDQFAGKSRPVVRSSSAFLTYAAQYFFEFFLLPTANRLS